MKLSKLSVLILLCIFAICMLFACSRKDGDGNTSGDGKIPPASDGKEIAALAALIGKSDADVVSKLGQGSGGSDDPDAVTIREYDTKIYGKDVHLTISYDSGKVDMLIAYADQGDFDDWASDLTAELGAPGSENEGKTDDSKTSSKIWNLSDGIIVSLTHAYGTLSVEIFTGE